MNWTTNDGGTLHIALGKGQYAQVEYGETRWQAYVGRLVPHPDRYGPTRFEKWGVACEFEDLFHAKTWCQGRIDDAQANLAKR
ncbi:hypothetical protein UFOVP184_23 [uncultured Caudovirales phage]|uniref:Uncharacterized protein n=1 Tax=uncultured Caudovirales phage TaxID=2100421 RepID=A0A6J7WGI3_9CAUD|nr:hypothetical protein UFOVP184_23 [uncultured Caudovirales phage]